MYNHLRLGVIGATLCLAMTSFGQQGPPDGEPPDFAQLRQRDAQRLKDSLGASDEDWKVMGPRIEKVQELRAANGASGPGPFNRAGGDPAGRPLDGVPPNGGPPERDPFDLPPSEMQQRQDDLHQTLQKKDATADEIKVKLAALRAERAKARAELVAAQAELRELLSVRQEAILVSFGLLD